ncbi:uncharacterized protein [Petaurus breviceps papuanus]|uniref:uncharacterized protein n=1 Tax=Petaurus breviceps papuanus TaxID=3040969 RepID=UPI0036DD31F5
MWVFSILSTCANFITTLMAFTFWFWDSVFWYLNKFSSLFPHMASMMYFGMDNYISISVISIGIVNMALLIHLASRMGSQNVRPLFGSSGALEGEMAIPGWEDLPYSSLAREWAKSTGPCENWEPRLKEGEPGDLERCLKAIPIEPGKELAGVCRRGWVLLTSYRLMCKSRHKLLEERARMARESAGLPEDSSVSQHSEEQTGGTHVVQEQATVHVAKRKQKTSRRNVHAAFVQAGQNCPDSFQENVCEENGARLDEESSNVEALPIRRRRQENHRGKTESREIIEDFTQQEITDILSRFTQRMGESLVSWIVRITDEGARGITLDNEDCLKFISIGQNPFVHQAFRDHHMQGGNNKTNLLALAAEGCKKQYPTESMWPRGDRPWYSLRDCMRKLKEEVMKTAILIGDANAYYDTPLGVPHRNIIVKTAPPAYKHLILTLLIGEIGHPLSEVLDKISQLSDLGEWEKDKLP